MKNRRNKSALNYWAISRKFVSRSETTSFTATNALIVNLATNNRCTDNGLTERFTVVAIRARFKKFEKNKTFFLPLSLNLTSPTSVKFDLHSMKQRKNKERASVEPVTPVATTDAPAEPTTTPGTNTLSLPENARSASWMVFVIVFVVYTATVYPSVSGGDAGELIVTTCNWGTAHPPGYPTYTMLGALFVRLFPFGTPAWRVNMMSVLAGSGGAALIHSAVTQLTGSVWPGLLAAFGFAFSPTVWLYSLQGEVFGLNNIAIAAIAFLVVKFFRAESDDIRGREAAAKAEHAISANARTPQFDSSVSVAVLGALVCGLAMTNQHTTVLYVAPTVLFVVFSLGFQGLLKRMLVSLLLFIWC